MIRSLLLIFFLCFGSQIFAQLVVEDKTLHKHVKNTPKEIEQDLSALHEYLSAAGETKAIQVKSYFLWIAHRIRYDQEAALALDKKPTKPTLRQTLRTRRAICTGYAQLFQAFCKKSNIPCQIVSGYTKNFPTSRPHLQEPDHAWNAVKIDGKWYLLDVTWAAGITQHPEGFPSRDTDYYFLPDPRQFLEDHLAADPLWQLLHCPLKPQEFQLPPAEMKLLWQDRDTCFALADSLRAFEQSPPEVRQIRSLQNAYDFNPTSPNARELGQAYLDEFIRLEDREAELQSSGDMDALLQLYPRLLALAAKAEEYVDLYDWQKENLAYSHLNFAVALSRQLAANIPAASRQSTLQDMQQHLLKAQQLLQSLPPGPFVQRGLDTCQEYLALTQQELKAIDN